MADLLRISTIAILSIALSCIADMRDKRKAGYCSPRGGSAPHRAAAPRRLSGRGVSGEVPHWCPGIVALYAGIAMEIMVLLLLFIVVMGELLYL